MSQDRSLWWFNALNVVSAAVLTGYVASEYLIPYVRRKWAKYSLIREKLQLDKSITLNRYEEDVACGAVHPTEIDTGFEDVGGLEEVIGNLQLNIQALISMSSGSGRRSKLLRAPTGVLLYGPPGCGKTLIAKAVARESGARFINVNLATILDKWVGETEKYVEALFSLAHKLKPCIIFIDEIDCLTRKRSAMDRDWNASMKAQFLSLWDGLTSEASQIVVLGATNRREDIDEAFLRRMPLQVCIGLPDAAQRTAILKVLLSDVDLPPTFKYSIVAERSQGLSGSDLREVCRRALIAADFSDGQYAVGEYDFVACIASVKRDLPARSQRGE